MPALRSLSRGDVTGLIVGAMAGAVLLCAAPSGGCSSETPATEAPRPPSGTSGSSGTPGASGASGASGLSGAAGLGGAAGASGAASLACGDGVCDHDLDEACETCEADCGACPVCGNGTCEKLSGLESCESCEADCGACSVCGDGTCDAQAGETCTTCMKDCGECAGCGDGTCDDSETCDSCAKDCGACQTCGDGTCDSAKGETCTTCADDCGACQTCGDGKCSGDETCDSCTKDCGTCQRKGCVTGDFKPYWGIVHAHTHISDGEGSPADAFSYARNKAKPALDFLWLSDHHTGITPAEWQSCVNAANKFNKTGEFAAGCGYEKSVYNDNDRMIGHFNVLFPDKLYKLALKVPGVYEEVAKCDPCLGQFNHPPWPNPGDGLNFYSYKFFPVVEDKVRLIEFNGKGSLEDKLKSYFTALANGWLVSPSWNEDNHHRGWGDSSNATLVWAPQISRLDLRASIKAHRTAAVFDDTATIRMMADETCWMGSRLQGLGPTTITVFLNDKQAGDGFGVVKLHGPDQQELKSFDCKDKNPCKAEFKLDIQQKTHLVAIARQKDGDLLISAPLWYEP